MNLHMIFLNSTDLIYKFLLYIRVTSGCVGVISQVEQCREPSSTAVTFDLTNFKQIRLYSHQGFIQETSTKL